MPPLTHYLRAYAGRSFFGFSCVVGAMVCGLAMPFVLRVVIDGLTTRTLTTAMCFGWAGGYAALGALGTLCSVAMRRTLLGISHRVEYDIRRDVFGHLTRLDAAYFQRERTGDIMTKMTSDLGAVREFIGQGLLQGSRMLVGFPLAFSIMFALDVQMSLAIVALLPVISLVFFFLIRLIRKHYDRVQDQFSAITHFAQENFAGSRTIKGFGIEERQHARFKDLNDEYIHRNMFLARIEEPVWPFMMLMFGVGIILLLWLGGGRVIRGEISLGSFVQFQQYLIFLQWPMLALGWTTNLIQRGLASWGRIRTILDAVPEVRDGADTDRTIAGVRGAIEFRHVTLRRGDRALLDRVDLRIPEGQCIGITGPTGSGKTLLVSLIVRLMDASEGSVVIGGRDVRAYPLNVLRRDIGIAPQEPFLFSDTLARNIALGILPPDDAKVEMPNEKIRWAADVSHLRTEVELFPAKFETLLGERGVTLSGGQRQRTAISRALARKPSILILDDVFSAVDTQTEAHILEQLLPVLRGRTSIIISHRISTLRHTDRVIVLQRGSIVQDGTHAALLAQPGYYQELDEIQRLEARLEESSAPSSSPGA
jgi:ATP-binding cassette subfamily B protein